MAEKKAENPRKEPKKEATEVAENKAEAKKDLNSTEFAVIETGGKQYKVVEGDVLLVEKLPGDFKEGKTVTFDRVLLVDDGKDTKVGTPYIAGAKVTAIFEEEGKHKKIRVIKFKAKSRYFKKRGHRQPYSKVKITALK